MEKFPGTPAGVLGAAINGKLTEFRLKHRTVAVDGDADADGNIWISSPSHLTIEAANFCQRLGVFSLLRLQIEQNILV